MPSLLPLDISRLPGLIVGIDDESLRPLTLELAVDASTSPAFQAAAREAFYPDSPSLSLLLHSYGHDAAGDKPAAATSAITAAADAPALADEADLTIILAGSSRQTANLMLQATLKQRPVVIACESASELVQAWPHEVVEIDISRLVAISSSTLEQQGIAALFTNLGEWVVDNLPDDRLAWARSLGFVRQAYCAQVIGSTSLQNAALAAAFIIPGADMPRLLANQVRMHLRLAAAHGADAETQRYIEVAALMLAAFGWRGLARRLAKAMPQASWAVKVAVGYAGTYAAGRALLAYLAAMPSLTIDPGFFSALAEALGLRSPDPRNDQT